MSTSQADEPAPSLSTAAPERPAAPGEPELRELVADAWQTKRLATGWSTREQILAPGDLTGDGHADIIVRVKTGELYLSPGTGTSDSGIFGARQLLGTGADDYDLFGRPETLTTSRTAPQQSARSLYGE
ncbi:hypothetical protein ACF1BK_16875 [Streptomyces globisporus]|uniref:hypothetical protein n=1 Tax=Streptomyces globisporus TaxID=1908 RepID=UPI0036FFA9CF